MKTSIVNTAPRQTKPSVRTDFNEAARHKFEFCMTDKLDHWTRDRSAAAIAMWNKYIPMTPQTAAEILRRDLPRGINVKINLTEDGIGRIEFEGRLLNGVSADFNIPDHVRDNGATEIVERGQGKGLGTKIIRNQIEFLHACGVRRFEVNAGMVGGYAWARMGYVPAEPKSMKISSQIMKNLKSIKPYLTKKEYKRLHASARLNSQYDLWKIADCRIDIAPQLRDAFNKSSPPRRGRYENPLETVAQNFASANVFFAYQLDELKDYLKKDKPFIVGRYLLKDTGWDGVINLNSIRQMKRIGAYTGGWKYLEFKAA